MHRVGDGVVTLQGDDRQSVDGQFAAQDPQETGYLTTGRILPLNGEYLEPESNYNVKMRHLIKANK